MVPLRIIIITKSDPLKKSLPKFAQLGAGCTESTISVSYSFNSMFVNHLLLIASLSDLLPCSCFSDLVFILKLQTNYFEYGLSTSLTLVE